MKATRYTCILSHTSGNRYLIQPKKRQESKEDGPTRNPLWGSERTMVIGQDKISYQAIGGNRNPAVLYLPAFDAPAHDYKADSLRS